MTAHDDARYLAATKEIELPLPVRETIAADPRFRSAVDEIYGLIDDNQRLKARITELEAERAGGQWFTEYVVVKNGKVAMLLGAYDSLTEATEDVHLYPGEHVTTRRVWYGPVTPAEPAAPDGPR